MSVLYPNVPNVPGVPAVLRVVGQVESTIATVTSTLSSLFSQSPPWGIFDDNGDSFADYDNVLEFEPSKEYEISNYPVEQGQFASSSKVELPLRARMLISCGGDEDRRSAFLADVEYAVAATDLYTIVTPEKVFENINITRYDMQRTAQNGVSLLIVGLALQEVRNTAVVTVPTTATASGEPAADGGAIQPYEDSGTGGEQIIGSDGLEGDVPDGLTAREGSPAADAIDKGEQYGPPVPNETESII